MVMNNTIHKTTGKTRRVNNLAALENRFIPKVIGIINKVINWRARHLLSVQALIITICSLVWQEITQAGRFPVIFVSVAIFVAGDRLLLSAVGYLKISFGPIYPQWFMMTCFRGGLIIFSAIISTPFPVAWSYPCLVATEAICSLVFIWGMCLEPRKIHRSDLTLQSNSLKNPLKILHITDLHIERLTRREISILELIENVQPELIFLTGDYLNLSNVEDSNAHRALFEFLSQLSAPMGIYATLGSPAPDRRLILETLFSDLDIQLLRDTVTIIDTEHDDRIILYGMDCSHNQAEDQAIFEELKTLPLPDGFRILLYHSPELMPLAREYPLDLFLCGHTHGGQFRLPFYGALLTMCITGKTYESGYYKEKETVLYVNRGVGFEGKCIPRMRLLCPPEVVVLTLEPVTP
jgi:predicted MPP superfamily phosphohydrolase